MPPSFLSKEGSRYPGPASGVMKAGRATPECLLALAADLIHPLPTFRADARNPGVLIERSATHPRISTPSEEIAGASFGGLARP